MSGADVVDYVDESLLDCVHRSRSYYNDNDGTTSREARRDEIPEDFMAFLEDHVGDGLAKVTVSGDLSSSHEYHGAKAFVSISVACNNNMDDINAVHGHLRPHVQQLCFEDHEEMSKLRDENLPPEKRLHAAEPKRTPSTEKVGKPPKRNSQRGSTVVAPKGVKKPSFRR